MLKHKKDAVNYIGRLSKIFSVINILLLVLAKENPAVIAIKDAFLPHREVEEKDKTILQLA